LTASGTDEHFFSGREYVLLPEELVHPLNKWCLSYGLQVAHLKSTGAASDQPVEVFILPLYGRRVKQGTSKLVATLGPLIYKGVSSAASKITEDTIMTKSATAAVDDLVAIINVRNLCLSVKQRPLMALENDPALAICV
jgi:hypothetical protein